MVRDQFGHPLGEREWRDRAQKSRIRMAARNDPTMAQRRELEQRRRQQVWGDVS